MSGGSHKGHPRIVLHIPEDWCDLNGVRRIPQGTSLNAGVTWCPEDPTRDIPGQSLGLV